MCLASPVLPPLQIAKEPVRNTVILMQTETIQDDSVSTKLLEISLFEQHSIC